MMTTFWPRLQRSPITARTITCEKCQILVPFPTTAPSSTNSTRARSIPKPHLNSDDLTLELQRHARFLRDGLAKVIDGPEDVARGRSALVDDVVGSSVETCAPPTVYPLSPHSSISIPSVLVAVDS